jgi:hypothetical protein
MVIGAWDLELFPSASLLLRHLSDVIFARFVPT